VNNSVATPHGNFWADLRGFWGSRLRMIAMNKRIRGKLVLEYFRREKSVLSESIFCFQAIRNRNYDVSQKVYASYIEKVNNLLEYLKIIPNFEKKNVDILKNEEKIFFTECFEFLPQSVEPLLPALRY
jgi:hypothetical protein